MYGRISVAPSEQLTPTIRGSACSIEVQNASIVWPESVRPLRSTMVTEIQRGSSGATSMAAAIAAFAFSVSKMVSMRSRSTPPSRRPRICSAYASYTWSNEMVRNEASSTFGDIDSVTFSGPSEPATKPPWRSADALARRAPSTFISNTASWSA